MKLFDFFNGRPERWTQGYLARDVDGDACDIDSPHAHSFCLVGAGFKLYSRDEWETQVRPALMNCLAGTLPAFNDAPGRKHADVVALCLEVGV